MLLVCQRCGHNWEYKGSSSYFTSCPICKTSVKIHPICKSCNVKMNLESNLSDKSFIFICPDCLQEIRVKK